MEEGNEGSMRGNEGEGRCRWKKKKKRKGKVNRNTVGFMSHRL